MSYSSADTPKSDPSQHSTTPENLDTLRNKLKGFNVLDKQEQQVGTVEDLILDSNQRLNLIISLPDVYKGMRQVAINSKLIRKVSNQTQTVLVDVTQTDLSYFPLYHPIESANLNITPAVKAPVQQLPATVEAKLDPETAEVARPIGVPEDELRRQSVMGYPVRQSAEDQSVSSSRVPDAIAATQTNKLNHTNTASRQEATETKASLHSPAAVQPVAAELNQSQPPLTPASTGDGADATHTPTVHTVLQETVANIPLLEERLALDLNRRKIGEVVIRKTIETRMVQVPVRYEKLIIEQFSPEYKQLAEVDLSQGEISGVELLQPGETAASVVRGEFRSPRTASRLLDAIAKTLHHRCSKIRIELELDDPNLQKTYQDWFNQCSQQ
jgi:stress response protein YsnF